MMKAHTVLKATSLLSKSRDEARSARTASEPDFRFYDNRQKYLMFVNTCSEKWVVAERASITS